ncbi:hypothetical protein [Virgibacillus ndiopensis]|uniref:hypothetical protein n=1 Tax=Virgibacillus ndiopensis TaxID=2004408 RepID=UPI000C07D145|nr:hypothetical protein [Virgibacillus ndiopensis]
MNIDNNEIITHGDIYERFCNKHSHLASYVNDYRPEGKMSIYLWFENGMNMIVRYNIKDDLFEIN